MTQRLVPDLAPALVSHMLRVDGPDHTRLRKLVGAVFTRRRVENLGPRIQQIADELLDGLAKLEPGTVVDLVQSYALPLPMTVICELMGVPEEGRAPFRESSATLAAGYFAEPAAFTAAATEQLGYVRRLIEEKRREPGDDLLSALIMVDDGGDRLSVDELTSMVYLLVIAGHETTANVIASGVNTLLTHPDQLALLRNRPELIDACVEELLRVHGAVQLATPVRALEPVEVGGVAIEAGELVLPALMAANHDPRRIDDPESFDITRADNPHVAFGFGIHYCLGAPLARLEGRIALASLFARFPEPGLAIPPEQVRWRDNFMLHGLTALPLFVR
jgi:cytochrome P450